MVMREISLAKNNLISATEFAELYAHDEALQKVAVVYHKYDQEKREEDAV